MAEEGQNREDQESCTRRPKSDVNPDKVKFLMSKGFSKTKISSLLGISRQTFYNHLKLWDSATFTKYTAITDDELDDKVRQIKLLHPNDGEVMMAGHLKS